MKRALIAVAAVAVIGVALFFALRRDAKPEYTRVELGGYPDDIDMARMVREQYAAIVALLDPNLPHERVLLEREQRLAAKAKLRVIAIAMRDANDARAGDAAAEAIRTTPGRIYVHSYLSVHRPRAVAERIGYPLSTEAESGEDVARIARARDLIRLRQYGGAIDLLEDIERAGPVTWQLRGEANLGLGILDEAESAFRIAILAEPRNAAALRGLGYVFLRANEIDMAREALRRSLAIEPGDAEARAVLSTL